ncbi:MAG: alanine:cation symporter family protein, partial [Clostridia bacterium]|nr:alanine:cation symporter family protein [Clostridia bacterium]
GSSPLAHATVENASADVQAKWGIFEIFFDTFVVSSITALCLLSSGFDSPFEMFFSSFGKSGGFIFGLLTAVFAFASVISWCYYAECCISFMFIKNVDLATKIYRILFSLASFFGVFISGESVWAVSDIFNALMMFPNLFLLFKCRNEIERID